MATSSQLLAAERTQAGALLYDAVVRTHLWVAAAVTTLSLFVCLRLGLEPTWSTLGIPFVSTLLIYNLDTALDLGRASGAPIGDPVQAAYPDLMRQRASKLASLALLWLLLLLAWARWETALLVSAGAGVGCLYAVPFGKRRRSLKAVPGIKSLVVGGAVAVAVVSVPVCENAAQMSAGAWTTLLSIFTLTFTNATLFDIRDVAQDAARGLCTLPVIFGVNPLRAGLLVFVSLSLSSLALCDAGLREHCVVLWSSLTPLILALGPESPRPLYAWLVDGVLCLPWLVTLGG